VTLVADVDGAARPIATVAADVDGHFQAFVTVPGDARAGSYTITAANGVDLMRAPIVIAGAPVEDGEQGQLLGQDEALAGALLTGEAQAVGSSAPARPTSEVPSKPADAAQIALVVVLALGLALAVGAVARFRGRRGVAG
jgi:hypothetical protein